MSVLGPGKARCLQGDASNEEGGSSYKATGKEKTVNTKKRIIVFSAFSLLLLALSTVSVLACEPPGTGTPGYWKNHPEAWPVEVIPIGGVTYPKADAIGIMDTPVKGDKTYTMFKALVAAKLNVRVGNESSCIDETIRFATEWLKKYPLGTDVKASGEAWQGGEKPWQRGEALYLMLDDYNNGELCAPSRDDLE